MGENTEDTPTFMASLDYAQKLADEKEIHLDDLLHELYGTCQCWITFDELQSAIKVLRERS